MDESDVDDTIHSLGFMFDAEHEKTYLDLTLRHLSLRIKTIGENPGHKQSGQYVWPASKAIGEYMIDNLESFKDVTNIIEFGSGCGIGGLTAAKLFSCGRVVLTDYDPGTLTLIEDSASLNGVEGKCSAQFLEWGNTSDPAVLLEPGSFDFAIGADLIYSKDVVAPLFKSVKYYLDSVAGRFLLVTSFALGEGIEAEIDETCTRLQIMRTKIAAGNFAAHDNGQRADENQYHGCRIELYTLR